MIIILSISVILNIVLAYLVWNTSRKISILETYASTFFTDLTDLKERISKANDVIQQADTLGAFESDDEVGTAFQIIKDCLKQLDSDTIIEKTYGKE